jgi:hypothetical protein
MTKINVTQLSHTGVPCKIKKVILYVEIIFVDCKLISEPT